MIHLGELEIKPRLVISGAGVSMRAGLPSGPALVESAIKKLGKVAEVSPDLIARISQQLPLEVFFQVVADHAGQSVATKVTTALDAEKPSAVHEWIAEKVEQDLIDRVYTFNFDTLHERALNLNLLRSASGRSVILESEVSDFCLIKLHGSADLRGIVAIGEYVQGFSDPVRERLLEDWTDEVVLVLGYGGWDADLAVTVDEAVAADKLPHQVVWVDRSFPNRGGRTALLSELESAGVNCHRILDDLYSALCLDAESKAPPALAQFQYRWEEFDTLDSSVATAIIAESAMLVDEVDSAALYLKELSGLTQLRLSAFLLERKDSEEAVEVYRDLARKSHQATTAALAATRVYSLTRGQQDCFNSVDLTALHPSIAKHFSAFIKSRRTDLGGLDRREAAARVRGLPKPHETAQGVDSLDTVRLYVSLLTESARLLHEARDYEAALALDKRAYRFAAALGDSALVASVSGGVGVCLLGIADSLSGVDAVSVRKDAVRWLRDTVAPGRTKIGDFTWGLYMCNLGSAISELGQPEEGVSLIHKGLPVLQASMPNWAVSAWAYLAGAYGDLYEKNQQEEDLVLGFKALSKGRALADAIDDYDDVYLLENVGQRLNKLS